MGEDQDAAGARGVDEAHRGDGLAGAGRVLEPEALVRRWGRRAPPRAGVLVERRPRRPVVVGSSASASSSSSSSSLVERRPRARRRRRRRRPSSSSSTASTGAAGRRASTAAVGAAVLAPRRAARSSVPESASTWCGFSSVPSARCGSSSRQQPLEAEQQRVARARHSVEGTFAPRVDLAQRGVERAPAGACRGRAPSRRPRPACTKRSRVNFSARAMCVGGGNGRGHDGH